VGDAVGESGRNVVFAQEAVDRAGCEGVAAADAVEDLQREVAGSGPGAPIIVRPTLSAFRQLEDCMASAERDFGEKMVGSGGCTRP
jgi:hypothetical protein